MVRDDDCFIITHVQHQIYLGIAVGLPRRLPAHIARVISPRSSRLTGRLSVADWPSDSLRLAAVTKEAAERLCRHAKGGLAEILNQLEPIPDLSRIDLWSLREQSDQRHRQRSR